MRPLLTRSRSCLTFRNVQNQVSLHCKQVRAQGRHQWRRRGYLSLPPPFRHLSRRSRTFLPSSPSLPTLTFSAGSRYDRIKNSHRWCSLLHLFLPRPLHPLRPPLDTDHPRLQGPFPHPCFLRHPPSFDPEQATSTRPNARLAPQRQARHPLGTLGPDVQRPDAYHRLSAARRTGRAQSSVDGRWV